MSIILLLLLLFPSIADAATFYIRPDGGNATQCLGGTDAPYDGSGTGEACALNHPNWVFPPRGESTAKKANNADVVVIKSGSYRIGCQDAADCRDPNVNLANSGFCGPGWPYDCYMGAVPSLVQIYGCSLTGCGCSYNNTTKQTTCTTPRPELWGAGRINQVLSLVGATSVFIQDIEITDHDDCGVNHSIYGCGSSDSNELTALDGLNMSFTTNVNLKNVRIHGLYRAGIRFGNVNGALLDNTNVDYNSFIGIDGDTCGSSGTCGATGNIQFINHPTVRYNGCVEDNPGYGTIKSQGCYSQTQGGYGDGIGMHNTGGNWVFHGADISHNTSDGLDLLYCNRGSYAGQCVVTIKRSNFEGNAGNPIKGPVQMSIEDTTSIANCAYFQGQSFTQSSPAFDHCRSNTGAIVFSNPDGSSANGKIISSTILTNADTAILATSSGSCSGTITLKNNIIRGGTDFLGGGDTSGVYYEDKTFANCSYARSFDYNICFGLKDQNTWCNGAHDLKTDPKFSGTIQQEGTLYSAANYRDQLLLQSTSPARGLSDTTISGADALDSNGFNRSSVWDAGAFEFGTTGSGTPPTCGNGTIDAGEVCDGANHNGETCVTRGFTSGTLACNPSCTSFNTSGCVTTLCGNGNIDPGEECDGVNLNNQTCQSQGFSTGTLSCSSCVLVTTGCSAAACGNGVLDSGEACDDGGGNGSTCSTNGCSAICEPETCPYELFLNYTKSDTPAFQSTHTQYVNYAGVTRVADSYLRKDFGAGYFTGDFIHDFIVKIDSCNDNGFGAGGIAGFWALSSSARTSIKDMTNNTDGTSFYMSCLSSSSQYKWTLIAGGTAVTAEFLDAAPVITRYIRVSRTSGVITAAIYSDANRTTLLGSVTRNDSTAYRYFYPFLTYNTGTANTTMSGRNSNYFLTAGGTPPEPPTPTTYGTKSWGCSYQGVTAQ